MSSLCIIGESIHCSRKVKMQSVGALPVADEFRSPGDRCRAVASAVTLAMNGESVDLAIDYVLRVAKGQLQAGASVLDINVDGLSLHADKNRDAMRWLACLLAERTAAPLSVDSADATILRQGIEAIQNVDASRRIFLNSASLDRPASVELACEMQIETVVSAAGADRLPTTVEERMTNYADILAKLTAAGLTHEQLHLDPLVFPQASVPTAANTVLETIRQVRATYPACHLTLGLSNVSAGLPERALLQDVFASLCMEAGGDGMIASPQEMGQDWPTDARRLAMRVLMNEDDDAMIDYLQACRTEQ
jgi:5-methyltetrahydrofolate corrinoid/iron sulfur protein methyltransferase